MSDIVYYDLLDEVLMGFDTTPPLWCNDNRTTEELLSTEDPATYEYTGSMSNLSEIWLIPLFLLAMLNVKWSRMILKGATGENIDAKHDQRRGLVTVANIVLPSDADAGEALWRYSKWVLAHAVCENGTCEDCDLLRDIAMGLLAIKTWLKPEGATGDIDANT